VEAGEAPQARAEHDADRSRLQQVTCLSV
jgi:hypothetical protein